MRGLRLFAGHLPKWSTCADVPEMPPQARMVQTPVGPRFMADDWQEITARPAVSCGLSPPLVDCALPRGCA